MYSYIINPLFEDSSVFFPYGRICVRLPLEKKWFVPHQTTTENGDCEIDGRRK